MLEDDVVLVMTNVPELALAKHIARIVVQEGLVACVHIGSPVESIYSWKGQVESAEEIPLAMKTTWGRYAALNSRITGLHPYEVPEVLVVPVMAGDHAYMRWVRDMTKDLSA